jgi:metal-dependent amidase/aminoacylase/carboxypeptidase family protein
MTRFTPDLFAGDHAQLTAIRRDIHRHPETAFEEKRTAQIVAEKLQGWASRCIADWPRPESSAP